MQQGNSDGQPRELVLSDRIHVGDGHSFRPWVHQPQDEQDNKDGDEYQRDVGAQRGGDPGPGDRLEVLLHRVNEAALSGQLIGPHGVDTHHHQASKNDNNHQLRHEHRAHVRSFPGMPDNNEPVYDHSHCNPASRIHDHVKDELPHSAQPVGEVADVSRVRHLRKPVQAANKKQHHDVRSSIELQRNRKKSQVIWNIIATTWKAICN